MNWLLQKLKMLWNRKKPISSGAKNTVLIGIGGGGQNIANYISRESVDLNDLNIISINSDEQALSLSKTKNILLCKKPLLMKNIGFFGRIFSKKLNFGCGADAEQAKISAHLGETIIKNQIKNSKKVILVSCFGGGAGTGATPVVAKFAKELGIAVTAVIIYPFKFEGNRRMKRAQEGVLEMKKYTENILELYNGDLLDTKSDNTLQKEFESANKKISNIIFENLL